MCWGISSKEVTATAKKTKKQTEPESPCAKKKKNILQNINTEKERGGETT